MPVDETVAKYSTEYEASIDPFRRFNIQEKSRKYMALRTHDKATLGIVSWGSAVIGTAEPMGN